MALKLITPPDDPLLSLDEIKRHVRAEDFSDDDTYLTALGATAEALIGGENGFLGRALGESTWAITLPCFPLCEIEIPLPPLVSITSIAYVDEDGDNQTYTEHRTFGVGLAARHGRILPAYDGDWPDTRQDTPEAVTVTFVAGYSEVPTPIKHAALLMVGDWYLHREETSEMNLHTMPHASTALLAPYRIWP